MNCKIDYTLYTGSNKDLDCKNIEALYHPYKSIKFEDNIIDIEKKVFTRKTEWDEFSIDFDTKMCELKYDENHMFRFKVEASIKIKEDRIKLNYTFDDELKKLDIYLKEVVLWKNN